MNKKGETVPNTRAPKYEPLCDYHSRYYNGEWHRTFDFHYIDPGLTDKGESDVAFYVTKYLLKPSKYVRRLQQALKLNLEPDEYERVWSLLKPRALVSKGWGLGSFESDPENNRKTLPNTKISDHIRKGIDHAKKLYPYPVFINPLTGQSFPLSPYYRKKYMTVMDAMDWYYLYTQDGSAYDNFHFSNEIDPDQVKRKEAKFNKVRNLIEYREERDILSPFHYEKVSDDDLDLIDISLDFDSLCSCQPLDCNYPEDTGPDSLDDALYNEFDFEFHAGCDPISLDILPAKEYRVDPALAVVNEWLLRLC